MFCPNCGTKNEIKQRFCRSCGIELKEFLQGLSRLEKLDITNTDWLKKLGVFSLGCFSAAIICLLCVLIFSSLRLDLGSALVFMMVLFGIALGWLAIFLFDNYELKNALKSTREPENYLPPTHIERWNTNKELPESSFEPIPSVTEPTTELFFAGKVKRKTSGELS
jgi:hypothetical protein